MAFAIKPFCNHNGTIDMNRPLPTMASITLKNIPEKLYTQLKAQAKMHHRSINGEVIHCLENAVLPRRISPEEMRQRMRRLREELSPELPLSPEEVKAAIEEGRE
jgi:plasmid stability protein